MTDIRFTIAVAGLDKLRRPLRDVQQEGVQRAQQALDGALDSAAEWPGNPPTSTRVLSRRPRRTPLATAAPTRRAMAYSAPGAP